MSNNEFEQQQFWNTKTRLPKGWVTEYVPGWDVNLTYNKEFMDKFFGQNPPKKETYTFTTLNFKDGK